MSASSTSLHTPTTASVAPIRSSIDHAPDPVTDPATFAHHLLTEVFDRLDVPTPMLTLTSCRGVTMAEHLHDLDAVRALRGRTATSDVVAVGFIAPAHITPVECSNAPTDGVVCHVLTRGGRSITIVRTGGQVRTFGPSDTIQTGRVPDSCRRILGLPTEPPATTMLEFVVASWLEVVLRRALIEPDLTWPLAVSLHPAAATIGSDPSAAEVARATADLAASLDWERFRTVIATIGGFPFDDDAEATAAWMDTGMFSRWALDELGDPGSLLELLESTLSPPVSERLWSAVRLIDGEPPRG